MLKLLFNKNILSIYRRQIQYLSVVTPYLLVFTFISLTIETVSFPGFIAKYILLNTQLLFLLSVFTLCIQAYLSIYHSKFVLNEFFLFILRLNRIFVVAILLTNYLFITLEKEHFANYIFANFHVHLSVLSQLVSLSVTIALIEFVIFNKSIINFIRKRFTSVLQIIFVVSVLAIVLPQAQDTATLISVGSIDLIKFPFKSYDEKIVVQMNGNESSGWVYTYGTFLKRNTPENAIIFIPPQIEPWLMEGNQYYMRWFVYPRSLRYSRELQAPIPQDATYVMIAHGSWPWGASSFGWPRISIPKEKIHKIIIIDRSTMEEKTIENIDYVWQEKTPVWGVIELKK